MADFQISPSFLVERQLDHAADSIASNDTRHAHRDIVDAILPAEYSGNGDDAALISHDCPDQAAGRKGHPGAGIPLQLDNLRTDHLRLIQKLLLVDGNSRLKLLPDLLKRHPNDVDRVPRNEGRLPVLTENEPGHILGIDAAQIAQHLVEARGIQERPRSEDPVYRIVVFLLEIVRQNIERVRYDD